MVEHVKLSDELVISRIITGLWQIADMERGQESFEPTSMAKHMTPYVDSGFTTFDMADHYGSAEIISGHFRSQSAVGKQAKLLTKWVPKPPTTSKEQVYEAVYRALDRLQIDRLDLLQYHAWNYSDPEWLDTLFWLQEIKNEGLIENLGVTNFDAAHLRVACASGIELVTNQISYSLLDQRAKRRMKQVCETYDVKILAFGTLAGGFLSERWLNKPEPRLEDLHTWSEMKYKRYIDVTGGWESFQSLLSTIKQIANEYKCSTANIASRFILDLPHVAAVVLGARLGESNHIKENLEVFNIVLSDEDRHLIQQAINQRSTVPGNCGDEYRKPPFLTASGDLSHHIESLPLVYTAIEDDRRKRINSGTVWEDFAGYSRAVRRGNRIHVSGTTATHGNRLIGGTDAAAQAHFVIDKIQAAIESLGGTIEDVDRTRIFVNNMKDWEQVARAHGERFRDIRPANTLVQAGLIGDGYLVEIEAEATVS